MKENQLQTAIVTNKIALRDFSHADNLNNFNVMISYCESFGEKFMPDEPFLTVQNLRAIWESASIKMNDFLEKKNIFLFELEELNSKFFEIKEISNVLLNGFEPQKFGGITLQYAVSLNKKIQSINRRKTIAKKDGSMPSDRSIVLLMQSFDKEFNLFSDLFTFILHNGEYIPINPNFELNLIEDILKDLKYKTENLKYVYQQYKEVLIERNHLMYEDTFCMIQIVRLVKQYVRNAFGTKSNECKKLRCLYFREKIR